jgi:hypothetical protein
MLDVVVTRFLPRSRTSSRYVMAFCITHTFRVELFDTYPACLIEGQALISFRRLPLRSDWLPNLPYYGGSVAVRFASFRRSRIYAHETLSPFRCSVRLLTPFVIGYSSQRAFCVSTHLRIIAMSPFRVCYGGWLVHHWRLEFSQFRFHLYLFRDFLRTGLAALHTTYLCI